MDREFIEVPKEYYCESAKQGRLVRIEYFNDSNLMYCVAKGGKHTYEYSYQYVYNALQHFLGRGE